MSAKPKKRMRVVRPQKGKYYFLRARNKRFDSCIDPTRYSLVMVMEVRYSRQSIWCKSLVDSGNNFSQLNMANISQIDLFLATDKEVADKKREMKAKLIKEEIDYINRAIDYF